MAAYYGNSSAYNFCLTYLSSLMWSHPVLYRKNGSGTWQQSSLSLMNLISYVIQSQHWRQRLPKYLRPCGTRNIILFLLCSSKMLLAQFTSHASVFLSTHTQIWKFLFYNNTSGSMYTALLLVCTPWCRQQTALWPCPRPFLLVLNGVWPCEADTLS